MYLNLSSCVTHQYQWIDIQNSDMYRGHCCYSNIRRLVNFHWEMSMNVLFHPTLVWCLHYFELPFDLTTDLLYELKLLYASSQIKYISGWGHDIHYHHPEHKTMPLINKLLDLEPPGTTYKDFLFSSQYHFGLLWKWREWNIWISSRQCIVEE